VQSVVADHGGTVSVESRSGGGTTFIITLPKAEA
jgi:signal transduction histidine kinase